MRLSFIAALGRNLVIGDKNRVPWHLPADLRHFRELTLGKPIIMGRATFDSIGRPLGRRRNIVLSRDSSFTPDGVEIARTVEEAMFLVSQVEEAMVIGGADVFTQLLPRADRLYLTEIDADFEGDRFFPWIDPDDWCEIECEAHPPDEQNSYSYTFVTLDRANPRLARPA